MSWEQFLVKGDKDLVRGFVHGFVWGAGDPEGVLCEEELPLERESIASLLFSGSHQRLLVRKAWAERLAQALENAAQKWDLSLKARQPVRALHFAAKAKAFSPEVAEQLKEALFRKLPSGIAVERESEKEERDPQAKGPELYAPVHHFQYTAEASYQGEVEATLQLHRKLATLDFVEVTPLQVLLQEKPQS